MTFYSLNHLNKFIIIKGYTFPSLGLYITGGAIAGILLGIWLYSINQRRKRRAEESKSNELPTTLSSKSVPASATNIARTNPSHHPYSNSDLQKGSTYFGAHVFSYEELEEATDNFDPSKEIGKGGFGKVYYGRI